jgi:hypothetical protein
MSHGASVLSTTLTIVTSNDKCSQCQSDLKPALIAFTPLFCMKKKQNPTKSTNDKFEKL